MVATKFLVFGAVLLATVFLAVADARELKQANSPPPVTASQLTQALSSINQWAKVPDISQSVAATPNYQNTVQNLQGPAQAIVKAANDFTNPNGFSQTAQEESNGLYAYGFQLGTQGLTAAGTALYNALDSLTKALAFAQ